MLAPHTSDCGYEGAEWNGLFDDSSFEGGDGESSTPVSTFWVSQKLPSLHYHALTSLRHEVPFSVHRDSSMSSAVSSLYPARRNRCLPELPSVAVLCVQRRILTSYFSALVPLPTHLPHAIYATVLTPLSIHPLVWHTSEAWISILEGLVSRFRAGERMARITRPRRLCEGEVESRAALEPWGE